MNEITRFEGLMVDASSPEAAINLVSEMILSRLSPNTQRSYRRAFDTFWKWKRESRIQNVNKMTVSAFVAYLLDGGMSAANTNIHIAAIKKLCNELADNNLIDPNVAGAIGRVESVRAKGGKVGNWLSKEQVEEILRKPDRTTLKGSRDGALLAIAIGCGLRRSEIVSLTVDHIARREGRWVILNLVGKGNKMRTVPMAEWVASYVSAWMFHADIRSGLIFRRILKGDHLTDSGITDQVVRDVLLTYAPNMNVAAHDLRRTFAKLAQKGGADIQQIQKSLGHSSIMTTERYLGTDQDFKDSPSDRIKLDLQGRKP